MWKGVLDISCVVFVQVSVTISQRLVFLRGHIYGNLFIKLINKSGKKITFPTGYYIQILDQYVRKTNAIPIVIFF